MHTANDIAKQLMPGAGTWSIDHVAGAFEEIAKWYADHGPSNGYPDQMPINHADILRELREMNMAPQSLESIEQQLAGIDFRCIWSLPTFIYGACGFAILDAPQERGAVQIG